MEKEQERIMGDKCGHSLVQALKYHDESWRDGLAIKNTGCASRSPKLKTQPSHGGFGL